MGVDSPLFIKQIVSGLRDFVSTEDADSYIPEWVLELTVYALPEALGMGSAQEQIRGSIILTGWSIVTSVFTGYVTVVFVFFWGLFLMIGIVRLSDVGDGAWSGLTGLTPGSMPGVGEDGSYDRREGGQ